MRSFSRKDLKIMRTVQQIQQLLPELTECYLPCKARCYLTGLTEKNVVTILRQILRTRHYTMMSREKYVKGEKFIIYALTPIQHQKYNPVVVDSQQTQSKKKKKK